jgi:hypothetical protein
MKHLFNIISVYSVCFAGYKMLRALCVLLLAVPLAVFSQTITTGWTIVSGTSEIERTAAQILRRELAARHHARVEIAGTPAKAGANTVYIGTPATLPAIAAGHAKAPFKLDLAESEGYHAVVRDGSLYIAGASPKGAMNGVFRFLEKNTAGIGGYDRAESPAFRVRVGNHLVNQHPPAEWTDDMQAEYYASHYINAVWGEKLPAGLLYEARKKYGVGLMAEVRFPPKNAAWMKDPKNAPAVFEWRSKKNNARELAISPFAPEGRAAYLEEFQKLIADNTDLKILYGIFADYGKIPVAEWSGAPYKNIRTGEPYGRSRADGIREILGIMKEAVGGRDIQISVWPWHSFYGDPAGEQKFMLEMAEKGIGVIYNEAGNADCWLTVRDNFTPAALRADGRGKTLYGDAYMPMVSAGGTCEATGAAVALPLPAVAGHKLSRLAGIGAKNFVLWWGGAEGWTYNTNMEVIAQMIWNPRAFDYKNPRPFDAVTSEPLLREIAARDFGPLAADVLEFWRQFDRAIVWEGKPYEKPGVADRTGLVVRDWYQRLGIYIRPYTDVGAGYKYPLTPGVLAKRPELKKSENFWVYKTEIQENYRKVVADIDAALEKLRAVEKTAQSADVRQRLADMRKWTDLYKLTLASNLNFIRAISAMRKHAGDGIALRRELAPVAHDEIATDDNLIKLLREFHPWASASLGTTAVRFQKEPRRDAEIKILNDKIKAMRDWSGQSAASDLAGRPNLALNKPATSLSVESKAKPASAAVDGDRKESRWVARLHNRAPEEWWQVDLGAATPVQAVVIYWTVAFAKGFEIHVSNDTPSKNAKWTTVYKTETGTGGRQVIPLPEGTQARLVRFVGQKPGSPWSFGFFEFEVY